MRPEDTLVIRLDDERLVELSYDLLLRIYDLYLAHVKRGGGHLHGNRRAPGVATAATYVSFFGVLMSMSNLSMERMWLVVPYLGTKFLKYLVIGVYLQVLILLLPISLADFLLSPSNPLFLYAGLDIALNVPLASALFTYVFAATVPVQARDELTYINSEYRARNALPILVFMAITSLGNIGIALLSLPLIFGTGLTVVLLLVLLLRDRFVRRIINRMTENGYV